MTTNIGHVQKLGENNFRGVLNLINFTSYVEFVPCNSNREKAPDMVIFANGTEIGTARYKEGKTSGNIYVSVAIKHAQLTRGEPVIYAALGVMPDQDDDDTFNILMN